MLLPALFGLLAVTLPTQAANSSQVNPSGTNVTYDYIVIGGGTGGLAIAARLAEDPSLNVAVIEAGGSYEQDNGNLSVYPAYALAIPFLATTEDYPPNPLVDWGLVSVPQKGALNRKIHYAQGKTLGGGSALNAMAYHRGTTGTYDRWAELVGDDSYTFKNLLPFYQKSCNFTPPNDDKRKTPNATVQFNPAAWTEGGGPLQVSYSNWVDVTLTWVQRAFTGLGLPISAEGFNTGSLTGATSWIPSTINPSTGTRSSSQTSFLAEAQAKTRIQVYKNTLAKKILFTGKKATGVLISSKNGTSTLTAKKEIILSAGVYHSPQLLMVSGIGPKETLDKYQIPVISDLAGVGQGLWDQPFFSVGHQVNLPVQAELVNTESTKSAFTDSVSGPLTSLNGLVAFEKIPSTLRSNFTSAAKTALTQIPSDWPEVEYTTGTMVSPDTGVPLGLIETALSAPLSRGTVTISSADISDPPVFDIGWYTDTANADAQVAVAAFKRMRQAWATISNNGTIGPEVIPGPMVQTDDQILTYIRNSSITLYHAGATCKMGKQGDTDAVVDSKARVFGVEGLRVVDLSAAPFTPPGHPQSTVYMLAEKIAADILNTTSQQAKYRRAKRLPSNGD